ncbi:MAG: hypothetical protein U0840_09370 [Gemmataceae bacterium]
MPCPACLRPLDALTAAGGHVDYYRFAADTPVYHCPDCGAVLTASCRSSPSDPAGTGS